MVQIVFQHHRPSIQKIFVDFNRFSCDCNMEALRLYLRASRPAWEALFGDGIQLVSFIVILYLSIFLVRAQQSNLVVVFESSYLLTIYVPHAVANQVNCPRTI